MKLEKLSWQRSARLQGLKGYERRCQGIKRRRFRKAKHTKKHIKNDSNRKIGTSSSRYDKQVTTTTTTKKRDCGRYL